MNKATVIRHLEIAENSLRRAGRSLQDFYGKDHHHALEMLGAAGIAREWIIAIEKGEL